MIYKAVHTLQSCCDFMCALIVMLLYVVVSDCDPLVECFLNGLRKCVDPKDDPDNDCILTKEVMTACKWP